MFKKKIREKGLRGRLTTRGLDQLAEALVFQHYVAGHANEQPAYAWARWD